ncbi:hypothetical protein [Caulobacter sp. LARHSG274]
MRQFAAAADLMASKQAVKRGEVLPLKLAPSGGAAVRLDPAG